MMICIRHMLVCVGFLKGASMKTKRNFLIGCTLGLGMTLGLLGSRMSSAQDKDNLKGGTILQRTELKGAPGWEAILVERPLPPGAESGKHTQAGSEIVDIDTGAV